MLEYIREKNTVRRLVDREAAVRGEAGAGAEEEHLARGDGYQSYFCQWY